MARQLDTWDDIQRAGSGRKRLLALVVGIAVILVGLWMFYDIATDRAEAREARTNWRQVPCELVTVGTEQVSHGAERGRKGRHRNGHSSSRIVIAYRYAYEGRDYTGDRYSVPDQTDPTAECKTRAQSIRQQARHSCYVNPEAPSESAYCLAPAREVEDGRNWLIPSIVCLAGLLGMLVTLWHLRPAREEDCEPSFQHAGCRASGLPWRAQEFRIVPWPARMTGQSTCAARGRTICGTSAWTSRWAASPW